MPQLRNAFDPPGLERELRLAERRRLDRQERVQWWVLVLLGAWLLTQMAAIAAVAATIGSVPSTGGPVWQSDFRPYDSGVVLEEVVAQIAAIGAIAFVSLTLTIAAILAVIAYWNRRSLPATWFVAGVMPWLILVVEIAGVSFLAVWYFA
ncbi:MAG: hypothetical protein WBC44_20040 [Planctomycetaceae bacterium]